MDNIKKAQEMLDQIFDLWTLVSPEYDTEERRLPLSKDELDRSFTLLQRVKALNIDDEEMKAQIESYETYLKDKEVRISALLQEIYFSWSIIQGEGEDEMRSPVTTDQLKHSQKMLDIIKTIDPQDEENIERFKELATIVEKTRPEVQKMENENKDHKLIWDKLDRLYMSWEAFEDEDGYEVRYPASSELKENTFKVLKKLEKLNLAGDCKARYLEIKNLVENYDFELGE